MVKGQGRQFGDCPPFGIAGIILQQTQNEALRRGRARTFYLLAKRGRALMSHRCFDTELCAWDYGCICGRDCPAPRVPAQHLSKLIKFMHICRADAQAQRPKICVQAPVSVLHLRQLRHAVWTDIGPGPHSCRCQKQLWLKDTPTTSVQAACSAERSPSEDTCRQLLATAPAGHSHLPGSPNAPI